MPQQGKRYDNGKNHVDLIPVDALWKIGEVFTNGLEKYGAHNWERGMSWSKVYGPMQRHSIKFWSGEDFDKESKLLHTAHIATNAMFLLSYQIRGFTKFDDRLKVKLNGI